MLDYRTLLEMAGIDLGEAVIVRHTPSEKSLKRVMPWLVTERPDLFRAYQCIQWSTLEKAMTRARYVVSFIGQEPGEATLAGVYLIGASQTLDHDGCQAFPGNAELEVLGMTGRTPEMPNCLAFDLQRIDIHAEWIGRLVVGWPKPAQSWWRWAAGGSFPVRSIAAESVFVRGIPDWREVILTWSELHTLPPSWRSVLAEWRGIYFIYDTARRSGYVGSACGGDNILGRWQNYARTGHGGNVELRNSNPADLRFSIMQRTSPDLEAQDVIALEASWKDRLHTREFGLNRN